jgi:hypothetical protein
LEGMARAVGGVGSAVASSGEDDCEGVADVGFVAASCGEVAIEEDVRCGNSAGGG